MAKTKRIKGEKTIAVDPRKEYVAGGRFTTYQNSQNILSPFDNDGFVKQHSAKTYEQMMTDPKIAKAINLLKISTLGDGVDLLPSLPESDKDYAIANEVAKFCEKALKNLDTPIRYTLEQMLDALIFGHKIAEVTYSTGKVKGFRGEFLLPQKIKVKKLDSVRFVVDDKGNVLGFSPSNIAKDLEDEGRKLDAKLSRGFDGEAMLNGRPILPREKFLVLSFRGRDNDPRGHSILNPAFNAWHLKTQVWPEYLRYLLLCAIPLLVGYTPENDTGIKEIMCGSDGQPIRDPQTGAFVEVNPVEALRDALLNARNAEVLAVKGGSRVQEIGAQGAGTPFFKAIELLDAQMDTAVLLQTLATSEGVHQSRAASTMHMSVLDQLVWWLKGIVVDMLTADLLRPLVRYNFGDDALEYTPKPSLGDTERREFATDANAVATLYKAGYLQPEQLKQTDAMLGLALRQSTDPLVLIQQLQAAGIPIAAVPPPPQQVAQVQAGPGGGVTPVPAQPSGAALPVGAPVAGGPISPAPAAGGAQAPNQQTAQPSQQPATEAKLPAVGRLKANINASPQNAILTED